MKRLNFSAGEFLLFFFLIFFACEGNAFAQWGAYNGYHMWPGMMNGYGYGMGWGGDIFMIIFWIFIIVALFFVIKWLAHASRGQSLTGWGETILLPGPSIF